MSHAFPDAQAFAAGRDCVSCRRPSAPGEALVQTPGAEPLEVWVE